MKLTVAAFVAYALTIFGANWAIATFGLVPVGFGLLAPAGVYFAGAAFPLRDLIQRRAGRLWSVGAVLVGGATSYLVSPHFAIASSVTFLVSEFADMAVYTPLQKRFALAVGVSSAVALVVDSALFLWLAFASLQFLPGQVVGKAWLTLLAVLLIKIAQHAHVRLVPAKAST